MTADELTEGCIQARKSFHGYGSIVKRALDPLANCRTLYRLGLFLAMNLIARRALASKIQHGLGADIPLEPSLEAVPLPRTSSPGPHLGRALGGLA